MIDIEKFICSLIHRSSGFCVIKVIDIIDALHYQGLDYKDGKIVRITPEFEESEDEKIIKNIGEYLNRYGNYIVESNEEKAEDVYKSAEWFKSFKDRYFWKPSDEQMEVLVWCMPLFADPKSKGILESLINDLKKLKEK